MEEMGEEDGPGITAQAPTIDQRVNDAAVKYNPEQEKQEHAQGKSKIEKLFSLLNKQKNVKPTKELMKNINKPDKTIEAIGVPYLDQIPEFAKSWAEPMMIKLYNLKNTPQERFKNQTAYFDTIMGGLSELKEDMTKDLFGKPGEIGGLRKQYRDLYRERKVCASVITSLDEEVKLTYARIDKAEKGLNEAIINGNEDLVTKLEDDVDGYHLDHEWYEDHLDDKCVELNAYDSGIANVEVQIDLVKSFRSYVRKQIQIGKSAQVEARNTGKETQYSDKIKEILPPLQKMMDDILEGACKFKEHNYKRMKEAAELTSTIGLQAPKKNSNISYQNPFEDQLKQDETTREEAINRAKAIVKNPYLGVHSDNNLN